MIIYGNCQTGPTHIRVGNDAASNGIASNFSKMVSVAKATVAWGRKPSTFSGLLTDGNRFTGTSDSLVYLGESFTMVFYGAEINGEIVPLFCFDKTINGISCYGPVAEAIFYVDNGWYGFPSLPFPPGHIKGQWAGLTPIEYINMIQATIVATKA